jgi:hypothetical protein
MKKYSMETIVGIFVAAGLFCVGYMAVKLGNISFFKEDPHVLYARFSSVSGLKVGSPIETIGIQVGNVQKIETYPLVSGEINVSFLDFTARKMKKYSPDELFVSVPYHRMAGIIESIPFCTAGTAKTEYPPEFKQLVGDALEIES